MKYRKDRVRSRGLSALSAGSAFLISAASIPAIVAGRVGPWSVVAATVVIGAFVLGVRSMRLGMYFHPDGLLIRGFVRTRRLDRPSIAGVEVREVPAKFGHAYRPVIRLANPPLDAMVMDTGRFQRRRWIAVTWLDSTSEALAFRRVEQIKALLQPRPEDATR